MKYIYNLNQVQIIYISSFLIERSIQDLTLCISGYCSKQSTNLLDFLQMKNMYNVIFFVKINFFQEQKFFQQK